MSGTHWPIVQPPHPHATDNFIFGPDPQAIARYRQAVKGIMNQLAAEFDKFGPGMGDRLKRATRRKARARARSFRNTYRLDPRKYRH